MSKRLDMRFHLPGKPRCSPDCRALLNSITPALCLISPDGAILANNQQAAGRLHLGRNGNQSKNLFDGLPLEAANVFRAAIAEVQRTSKPQSVSYVHDDQLLRCFLEPTQPDQHGNIRIALMELVCDAPLPDESFVDGYCRTILDHAAEMLFVHDLKGNILEVNRAAQHQTGYTRDELLRMQVHDLDASGSSLQQDREAIWPLLGENQPLLIQRTHRRKDGSTYIAEIRLTKVSLGAGTCVVALASDVTDRIQTRQRIEENERRLTTLMSNLPGIVYRCKSQPEWPMLFVSSGISELTGYPPETFIGAHAKEYGDLIHPDDRARVWNEIQNAASQKKRFICEYRIITADGRAKWVWEQGCQIADDTDGPTLEGFIIDITEFKRLEQKSREIALLEQHLREHQKEDSIRRIMGAVAHHFNNKMHAILGSLELADMEQAHLDLRKLTETIENTRISASEAAALSRKMLDCLGQFSLHFEPVALENLLREEVTRLIASAPEGIEIQQEIAAGQYPMQADPLALREVVQNIVRNAFESEGVTSVNICLSEGQEGCRDGSICFPEDWAPSHRQHACIRITDNGEGISPTMTRQIFDPFFTTRFPGRGIGLTASLELIRGHGGCIFVKSREGEGTCFCLILPLSSQTEDTPGSSPATWQQPDQKTILLVDDEAPILHVAALQLRDLGYHVLKATSARQAIKLFRETQTPITALLIDVRMPGESGWDLMRSLHQEFKDLPPIILVSAYQNSFTPPDDSVPAPDGFLMKPYLMSDIAAILEKCARQS